MCWLRVGIAQGISCNTPSGNEKLGYLKLVHDNPFTLWIVTAGGGTMCAILDFLQKETHCQLEKSQVDPCSLYVSLDNVIAF